jgi:hypothetical protein
MSRDIDQRRLARDVARRMDRRRLQRKMVLWTGLLAAIVLAVTYLTCGQGWGIGGKGKGEGEGGAGTAVKPAVDAKPRRCSIKLSPEGITVDGKQASREEAVKLCKGKHLQGADVTVTGDTRQGDWDDLRGALDAAGITIFKREPKSP